MGERFPSLQTTMTRGKCDSWQACLLEAKMTVVTNTAAMMMTATRQIADTLFLLQVLLMIELERRKV